ncbi:hypothetical protein [Allosphingosinicella deserti]|uniref:Uncharacterized protein n=1 Tax=Allosphingosinicella deserti TaxID=2116704 RepID=A0A2P7QR66_9SPHN|nr:hypothetical protein [Sphingomonas deserti]PSJ40466.1 hypothetical protein C7I55_09010 [Sphingomonas deserti]
MGGLFGEVSSAGLAIAASVVLALLVAAVLAIRRQDRASTADHESHLSAAPPTRMQIPIRNSSSAPLTLFIEPICDQYEIPVGGEAIVTLRMDADHMLDWHEENWLSLWDGGVISCPAQVKVAKDRPWVGRE